MEGQCLIEDVPPLVMFRWRRQCFSLRTYEEVLGDQIT